MKEPLQERESLLASGLESLFLALTRGFDFEAFLEAFAHEYHPVVEQCHLKLHFLLVLDNALEKGIGLLGTTLTFR